jgi:hypothetical protein
LKVEYDRYLILASYSKKLRGDYSGYVGFIELIEVLEVIAVKQISTYLYNGNHYTSKLTMKEINVILDCVKDGKYQSGFDKLKVISNQVGIRRI